MALLAPVANATITLRFAASYFAEPAAWHVGSETARFSKYLNASYAAHFHLGEDFAAPLGVPVYASEAGRVLISDIAENPGPYAGGGLILETQIDGGMRYVNCHLSSVAVKAGALVQRGQVIGHLGQSGSATGPHDHFIVCTLDGGVRTFRNPDHYLPGGKYANSDLIKPAAMPDTGTEDDMLAWVNGIKPAALKARLQAGQPVRTAPVLSESTVDFTVATTSTLTVIGKVAGDLYLGSTTWYVYVLGKGGLRVVHAKQVTLI